MFSGTKQRIASFLLPLMAIGLQYFYYKLVVDICKHAVAGNLIVILLLIVPPTIILLFDLLALFIASKKQQLGSFIPTLAITALWCMLLIKMLVFLPTAELLLGLNVFLAAFTASTLCMVIYSQFKSARP